MHKVCTSANAELETDMLDASVRAVDNGRGGAVVRAQRQREERRAGDVPRRRDVWRLRSRRLDLRCIRAAQVRGGAQVRAALSVAKGLRALVCRTDVHARCTLVRAD